MDFKEFKSSLAEPAPPSAISNMLLALWYDAKGNWHKAHEIAQDINNTNGSWIHAYLHRKEGDDSNAGYWYSRAGKNFSKSSLQDEWEEITKEMLK